MGLNRSTYPPSLFARFRPVAGFFNRIVVRFAGRFGMTAILEHRGRKSGRIYRTPVVLVRSPDGIVLPMAFGVEAGWCRNVLAAGEARYLYQGRWSDAVEPRLAGREGAAHFNRFLRLVLRLVGMNGFMLLRNR